MHLIYNFHTYFKYISKYMTVRRCFKCLTALVKVFSITFTNELTVLCFPFHLPILITAVYGRGEQIL